MNFATGIVTYTLRSLSNLLCRVDLEELRKVPARGPLILVGNHVNFLDAPVIGMNLQPRPLTGFAKVETWDNPWLGALFSLYGAIPLRRGVADVRAMQRALAALEQGKIVAVAPEGTRSGHGRLQKGRPGVVTLALHSGAPLLPMVFWGGDTFYYNVRRLRRTPFHIRIGPLLRLETCGEKVTREVRQAMTDELMGYLAALLPEAYRGYYANREMPRHYLEVINPQ